MCKKCEEARREYYKAGKLLWDEYRQTKEELLEGYTREISSLEYKKSTALEVTEEIYEIKEGHLYERYSKAIKKNHPEGE